MEERDGKNKFWNGVLVGALVTAFCGLIVVGGAAGIWIVARGASLGQIQTANEADSESGTGLNMTKIGRKLEYMQSLIDTYYLFGDEEQSRETEDWIYTGFVNSLDDPYSTYYNAEEYKIVNEETDGQYCGIGVQVSQNIQTGIITVIKEFKGSPAEEAGMLPGDILYKVEGIPAAEEELSLLVNEHIKGEEGTRVSLEVYRQDLDEYVEMSVERRIVENPTVEHAMLEDEIGYISVSAFDSVTINQFKQAVDALEEQEMEGLIVDLRNNGGGVVQAAEEMTDYLLPDEKLVVAFKGKGMPDSSYYSKDGHQVDVPIVVLVNEESASASEVFTGALRDNDWAKIVGIKTFGKGIAQGIFEMEDGSALKLTTAYYYVPSGECIHEVGIEPDVEVELEANLRNMIEVPKEEDNQLQAAVGVLIRGEEAVLEELAKEAKSKEKEE